MNPFKRKKVEVRPSRDASEVKKRIEKMKEINRKLEQLLNTPDTQSLVWYTGVGDCLRVFKEIYDGTWDGK
jgi:hypothetical protein